MINCPPLASSCSSRPPARPAIASVSAFIVLWVLFLLSPALLAQNSAEPEPDTIVISDTLHHDDIKRQSTFTGNVVMTRGQLVLYSDKLVLSEDDQGFQFGVASLTDSDRVRVRQENPEDFEVIRGEGLRAEWDGKQEELELIGQAIITRYVCGQPVDEVRGDRVIYYQTTDTYEAFGGPASSANDERVRSVVRPRAIADQALEECRARANQ